MTCGHESCEGCVKQLSRKELEDAQAEDEAFAMIPKTCDQLGVCQSRNPPCQNCPRLK